LNLFADLIVSRVNARRQSDTGRLSLVCNHVTFMCMAFRWINQKQYLGPPNLAKMMILRHPGLGLIMGPKGQSSRSHDSKVSECLYTPTASSAFVGIP